MDIKGANKTGFSCLFPHYHHKKLIQMGEVKKMAATLNLTASRWFFFGVSKYRFIRGKEKEYLTDMRMEFCELNTTVCNYVCL